MKHLINNKLTVASIFCVSTLILSGCGGGGSSSADEETSVDLSDGLSLSLSLLNAGTGAYYSFDSETEARTDLNEIATGSQDSSIQNLAITDTSTVGYFLHWPDFREVDGEEQFDMKYLLMRPTYQHGTTIDADQMVQLAHLHGDTLAAHSAEEFRNPEPGSSQEQSLLRLNSFVAEQNALEAEVTEVMPAGTQLCRAYIDPYLKFEEEEEHAAEEVGETTEEAEEEHEHDDLVHYALDTTGRMYFFAEGENGLEQMQGFVQLDEVSNVSDCSRTTVARVSEDGVLVFIPDTQRLYLVDSHGGDFHQHSTWPVSALLPENETTDLVAIIGTGEEHDHDHE
ncbi:hypothetical protein OO007_18880 [Cocleimonas sp. KMM 6892]|uniref:hypothetical protein n=1 Tax=unclassified Cocleimonas TaxID=2639732 RepID=UPI002DBBA690|nr:MULTISPECIES: hypothetical protein [unclassified Cocleimonas]MEB8434310.1 hypothetical protein [Cocleimonas sp. KMM 6892]MEC4717287.1 hypothetical protein [Cocleimonas sp. KMM 6895]MEC4746666.1 hypothetical protein [Cocleimonas sp. KMM 6896]